MNQKGEGGAECLAMWTPVAPVESWQTGRRRPRTPTPDTKGGLLFDVVFNPHKEQPRRHKGKSTTRLDAVMPL